MLTRLSVCSAAALMLVCQAAVAQSNADRATPEEVRALLPPHKGAAVMAIDGGEVVFQHAWGERRLGDRVACTPTTNFRLASVSKHFTATSVLLLVDRDLVRLDQTIDRFFPGCPDYWRQITVEHLLLHTSGLPDYESLIPDEAVLQLSDLSVLGLLLDTEAPVFEPGSRFAYSNSGYVLLGLIVEQAAGRPLHDFMQAEVFRPAGMERSVLHVKGMNTVPERAMGHTLDENDAWSVTDQSLTSAARGDGGVYSSLADLRAWIDCLNNGGLLSPALHEAMFTPQVKSTRGESFYGYGWFLDEYRGERRAKHGGASVGFSTALQRFPERDAAVVILLNRSPPLETSDHVERIVDRLLFAE